MVPLKNQKHEAVCHQIIEAAKYGRTQGQAYSRAGFKTDGAAAEANASRLLKNANIQIRLAELGQPAAPTTHCRRVGEGGRRRHIGVGQKATYRAG